MEGIELKILFKNSQAFLMESKAVNILNSDLNVHVNNSQSYAYWVIRIKKHIEQENRLFCEVISYNQGKSEFDNHQKQLAEKLSQIKNISFNKIDTFGLISTLLKNGKRATPKSFKPRPVEKQQYFPVTEEIISKPLKYQINKSFDFPIKNLDFKNGFVSFEQKLEEYPKRIQFTIENKEIIEEYDAVKNYFENVLKVKKVRVTVKVDIEDYKVVSSTAESPEIKRINKQLIEEVKLNFVKSTIKNRTRSERESDLLTAEEYFETFSVDGLELKAFYENDEELLKDIIKISDTKHYKHLRYLSSGHLHQLMRLRFLHRPRSFIFLIDGDDQYHFVWETLNTEEATYVWHVEKNIEALEVHLDRINEIIKIIKTEGKLMYIINTEDEYSRVFHDYNDSINGFLKWKKDFEKVLE